MLLCQRANELTGKTDAPSQFEFQKILSEVSEYSRYHFAEEEALLRKYNYSDLATHVDEHEKLYDQVSDLLLKPNSAKREQLVPFLTDWINLHILQHDMKYKYILACPIG